MDRNGSRRVGGFMEHHFHVCVPALRSLMPISYCEFTSSTFQEAIVPPSHVRGHTQRICNRLDIWITSLHLGLRFWGLTRGAVQWVRHKLTAMWGPRGAAVPGPEQRPFQGQRKFQGQRQFQGQQPLQGQQLASNSADASGYARDNTRGRARLNARGRARGYAPGNAQGGARHERSEVAADTLRRLDAIACDAWVTAAITYMPDDVRAIRLPAMISRERTAATDTEAPRSPMVVRVCMQTTLQACEELALAGDCPCALNFASARRPGGGFLSGTCVEAGKTYRRPNFVL